MKKLSEEDLDLLEMEVPIEEFKKLKPDEMAEYLRLEQRYRKRLQEENKRLKKLIETKPEQLWLLVDDKYSFYKRKIFGSSSERREFEAGQETPKAVVSTPKEKAKKVLLPSERYPNAPVEVIDIELKVAPACTCCGKAMKDTGMVEESEYLHVIPKQYRVVVQRRHKYACGKCYGTIATAPAPARIKEGSAYSDPMMIDVALTKYCDLVPIERYAAMAAREGFPGIPTNSLIECTHYVAEYVEAAYGCIKQEVSQAKWLHADETTHRMLEGSSKPNWFLWSFSTPKSCYFEYHSTRSGDVASKLLTDTACEFLLSDVYSGYHKAVADTNKVRAQKNLPAILQAYCNAHARRKFVDAEESFPKEATYFIKAYQEIFILERAFLHEPDKPEYREKMRPIFERMRDQASSYLSEVSEKSSLAKAIKYFIGNYDGLTLGLTYTFLPIHNNAAESNLRSSVVGRKTWYGTHSKLGAKTAAIMFSIVQSCKLNQINPREYMKRLIADLHQGKAAYSPAGFATMLVTEAQASSNQQIPAQV